MTELTPVDADTALVLSSPKGASPPSSSSFFKDVRDILVTSSTLVNIESYTQCLQSSTANACHLLELNRVSGAEIDSVARHPPPRCHPNTRKALRERFTTWHVDPNRTSNAFWILGSAGVGKSAVAQTIAEHCRDTGCLGATFFFSSAFNDSTRIIPTLVHQLVVRFPDYKQIVAQLLATDTTIFERNLRSQFQSLITQPFAVLKEKGLTLSQHKLLIVLDGLEQCKPEGAQRELIVLITQQCESPSAASLSWLICSRPERHIRAALSRKDARAHCHREELRLQDDDAQRDISQVLQDGLETIREEYSDVVDETWPSEDQLQQLVDAAGGYFPFVPAILEIVGDREFNDPRSRLEDCLRAIGDDRIGGANDPSKALKEYRGRVASVSADAPPPPHTILLHDDDAVCSPDVAQQRYIKDNPTNDHQDNQSIDSLNDHFEWKVEQDTVDLVKSLQSCPRTWEGLSQPLIDAARLISGSRDKESLEEICFRGLGNAVNTSLNLARSSALIGPGGIGFYHSLVSPSFLMRIEDARRIMDDTKAKTAQIIVAFQDSQRGISSVEALQDVDRKLQRDNRPPHQALLIDLIDGWRHLKRAKSQLVEQDGTNRLFTDWWKRTEERLTNLDCRLANVVPQEAAGVLELCDDWKSLTHRIGSYVARIYLA